MHVSFLWFTTARELPEAIVRALLVLIKKPPPAAPKRLRLQLWLGHRNSALPSICPHIIPGTCLADQGTVMRNKERGSHLDQWSLAGGLWAVTWVQAGDRCCKQDPLQWTSSAHLRGFQSRQKNREGSKEIPLRLVLA